MLVKTECPYDCGTVATHTMTSAGTVMVCAGCGQKYTFDILIAEMKCDDDPLEDVRKSELARLRQFRDLWKERLYNDAHINSMLSYKEYHEVFEAIDRRAAELLEKEKE